MLRAPLTLLAFDHVGRDIKEVAGREALNYKGCLRCQQVTGNFFYVHQSSNLLLLFKRRCPIPPEPLISADQLRACLRMETETGGTRIRRLAYLNIHRISWRSGSREQSAPHLSLMLNVKHAADTGPEVFLLCFILFPRHYILTLTFGCDKRKALNPAHIHSGFRALHNTGLLAALPHSAVQYEQRAVPGQCSDSGPDA